jgi:hypothetical protein
MNNHRGDQRIDDQVEQQNFNAQQINKSTFAPAIATLDAFVKDCHGLIGRPQLMLSKVGTIVIAL